MDDEPIELRLLREKLAAKAAAAERRAAKEAADAARKDAYIEAMRLQAQAKLALVEERKARTEQARLNKRSAKDKADDELFAKTQAYHAGLTTGVLSGAEILARNAAKAAEIKQKEQEARDKDYAEWLAAQTPEYIEAALRREQKNKKRGGDDPEDEEVYA